MTCASCTADTHKQVLAGANAEVCYSKYGSMPTKVSHISIYLHTAEYCVNHSLLLSAV
jgi:hypothetical protein